jgi:hypothetical protein
MEGCFLSGFLVDNLSNSPLEISHQLFVDDTLIMCDADVDQIHNLDHILLCKCQREKIHSLWVVSGHEL